MIYFHQFPFLILIVFLQSVSCAVLEKFFKEASSCETSCNTFFSNSVEMKKSCAEGCRLYIMIYLAKEARDVNKTTELCVGACSDAFVNESETNACNYGCSAYPPPAEIEEVQTLHLLIPLWYMKSAYNMVSHHVKQFISASWTVYVQEDSGKTVLLQTGPKVVESLEFILSKDQEDEADYPPNYPASRSDWMDCISHQSGIPRWLLVTVLFGFVFALLWLCCATTVTAPHQYVNSNKRDLGYVLVCEANRDAKIPLLPPAYESGEETEKEEAPPLPPKVSLI